MCNKLHKNFKPIPISGTGYKLFRKQNGFYTPLYPKIFSCNYYLDFNQLILWDNKKYHNGLFDAKTGFCFFTNLKVAKTCKKYLDDIDYLRVKKENKKNCVLCKIEYNNGLGKVEEKHFILGHKISMSLCQEFKITEEINV